METLKNFLTGLLIAVLAFFIFASLFLLWPIVLGIGSLILSAVAIILAIILGFYIIVFIGHIARKGFKG